MRSVNSLGTSVSRCEGQLWFRVVLLALSALNLGLFLVFQGGIVLKPERGADGSQLVPSWGSSKSGFVHPGAFYPVTVLIFLFINIFFPPRRHRTFIKSCKWFCSCVFGTFGEEQPEAVPVVLVTSWMCQGVSRCRQGMMDTAIPEQLWLLCPVSGIISCAEHPIHPNPAANPLV